LVLKKKNSISPLPPIDRPEAAEGSVVLATPPGGAALLSLPRSRAIWQVAGPAMASFFAVMLFSLVDAWWVGRLGAEPLAGVSGASFVFWALEAIGNMASTGMVALVAQYTGARRTDKARHLAGQGLLLALSLGVLMGWLTRLLQKDLVRLMGMSGRVASSGGSYLSYISGGLFLIYGSLALEAVFRGQGDTRTPFKIISVALLLNAILDPFFIFGIGPFPRLEAAGAALATVLARAIGLVASLIILRHRQFTIKLRSKSGDLIDWQTLGQIVRIGAPIAFSGMMFSISYMLLTRVISPYGSESLAALGLGHRLEGLFYFTALGFSVAAAALVGQNIGAGRPREAEKSAWGTLGYACAITAVLSILYFMFAEGLIRFFIDNAGVIGEGRRYLRIITIFEVFLAFEVVLEGAFSGSGHSLPPMLVSVPLTLSRIPLALYLSGPLGLGSTGIWWAISATTGVKGIIIGIWFKTGTWKKNKITL